MNGWLGFCQSHNGHVNNDGTGHWASAHSRWESDTPNIKWRPKKVNWGPLAIVRAISGQERTPLSIFTGI